MKIVNVVAILMGFVNLFQKSSRKFASRGPEIFDEDFFRRRLINHRLNGTCCHAIRCVILNSARRHGHNQWRSTAITLRTKFYKILNFKKYLKNEKYNLKCEFFIVFSGILFLIFLWSLKLVVELRLGVRQHVRDMASLREPDTC